MIDTSYGIFPETLDERNVYVTYICVKCVKNFNFMDYSGRALYFKIALIYKKFYVFEFK